MNFSLSEQPGARSFAFFLFFLPRRRTHSTWRLPNEKRFMPALEDMLVYYITSRARSSMQSECVLAK